MHSSTGPYYNSTYSHLALQVVIGAYSVLGKDGSLRDHVSGDAESGDLVGGGESED